LTERGYSTREGTTLGGLGLAIVQQLADKNFIVLSFFASPIGGLAAQLTFDQASIRQTQ
jgi:signal transduction histidine kinase